MKYKLSLFFLFFSLVEYAQTPLPVLRFRQGIVVPQNAELENIDPASGTFQSFAFESTLHIFLQFKGTPSVQQKKELLQRGIELLEYIPDKTYLVKITGKISKEELLQLQVINIVPILAPNKIDPVLVLNQNDKSIASEKNMELLVTGFPGMENEKMIHEFAKLGIKSEVYKKGRDAAVKLVAESNRIQELAGAPFVYYIEELPPEEIPLNNASGVSHGTTILQNSLPGIGRNLSGKGVVIGMGDNGGAGHHIDHYYKTIESWPSGVYHSSHVAGIMAGAGLIDPRMKGRAPEASLVVELFSDIFLKTPQYYSQFGMLLTNNSYGSSASACRTFGGYNSNSQYIDQQLLDYPAIMHVFATGNEVTRICPPFPAGFQTVFGGAQSAKNTITVGGSNKDPLTNFYSKGPTLDGRIKPEITAIGRNVFSTVPFNVYGSNFGTSMACPQVTGSLALLIERYRQLNNGSNPPGALLKNIICNASIDIGNTGPDFANGYGSLDALSAVEMLEKKNYYSSSIEHGQQQNNSFTIGANTSEVKVMLYWPDKPASLFASSTLVNDLDLVITSPDGTIYRPLILNADPGSVLNTAIAGEDHSNNMEQVIIRNPIPGLYTVTVKGFLIPFGPQPYFVSYNILDKGLKLLSPLKKDSWKGGETQVIKWIEPGENPITYQVDFSTDGGLNWQTIGTTSGNTKQLNIQVPSINSINGQVRITNRSSGESTLADSLLLLPELNFKLESTCHGIINVNWADVPEIDSFAVLIVNGGKMNLLGATSDTFFNIRNLSADSVYWISISPIKNGLRGERAIAKSLQPVGTGCTLTELDGDIEIMSLVSPLSGRKNTSTERTKTEKITIQLLNRDNNSSIEPIIIKTFLNNTFWSQDTATTAISPYGSLLYTIQKPIDLSLPGNYSIRVSAQKAGDPNIYNNSIEKTIKIPGNQPIQLPFAEDFEMLKDTAYGYPGYFGLEGKDNWDYSSDNYTGILKTLINPANKGLLPQKLRIRPLNVTNTIIGTFNFSNYSVDDNIFLSFNKINNYNLGQYYLRGSDTSAWVPFPFVNGNLPTNIHRNITQLLTSRGQDFSSSFQIRFDNFRSEVPIVGPDTIPYLDNINFYRATDDLTVFEIKTDLPRYFSNDTVTITTTIVNNTNKKVNKVSLQISSPSYTLHDSIPFINAYDTIVKVSKVNASKSSIILIDTIRAKISCATDLYSENNENISSIIVLPVLDTFPYVEGFEKVNSIWTSNSFYYQTTNQLKERYILAAANGKKFWYTANVSATIPEIRTSVLTSQGIDISNLKNPYLSFSIARYLRNGRDSTLVQISNNKGASWKSLNSVNSSNWYNYNDNKVWSDSNKVYWHSVSCQLPDTSKRIMLRIITLKIDSFKTPIWLGSSAIDDIHIYDAGKTVADSISQEHSGVIENAGNGWKEININGKLSAAINFNGQNAGTTNWQLVPSKGFFTILNGRKLLKNRWIFKSSKEFQKPVRIRLYFSDREAEMLRALNKCTGCPDTVSAYNFSIYQFADASIFINALKRDNTASRYKIMDASQFDLIPYINGYYAEFITYLEGEFYIQMPERFALPGITFSARPYQNNEALLSFSLDDYKEIERIVVEKAIGDNAFEAGDFLPIGEQSAGATLSYSFLDKLADITKPNYYRLKIVFKNGYLRYTPEQIVTLGSAGRIWISPNPSNGLFTISLSQTNGEEILVQLVNSLGQVILSSKREPSGTLEDIKIDIRKEIFPPGVYFLKIINGKEINTFKLVKQ